MKFWWLCVIIFGHFFYCWSQTLYEDSICPGGICTKFFDCPQAYISVQSKGFHNFMRCGFTGFTEIVCCPSDMPQPRMVEREPIFTTKKPPETTRKTNLFIRKSQETCEKYTKDIPISAHFYIAGGEDALEAPYMAALGLYHEKEKRYKFNCGGVLISEKYVLTAAHCLFVKAEVKLVRLGTVTVPKYDKKRNNRVDYEVAKATIHPKYSTFKRLNDIALVKLRKTVVFTEKIQPACLYTNKKKYPQDYIILGWGIVKNLNTRKPLLLQKAFVKYTPFDKCKEKYRRLTTNQICAQNSKSDICEGDSGGPLLMRFSKMPVVVGISSFGQPGCWGGSPSVYCSVSKYLDWIENIVWGDDDDF